MKIDRKTIEHLERLARIELGDAEREQLAGELTRIVEFVEKLDELVTPAVDAGQAARPPATLREDVPEPWPGYTAALGQAPETENGCYRVPRVIDRGEDN
jgi:aspartyl-tRNA(Asn)/glutamyl-tRNA(Gln) amidotransferase subunit C